MNYRYNQDLISDLKLCQTGNRIRDKLYSSTSILAARSITSNNNILNGYIFIKANKLVRDVLLTYYIHILAVPTTVFAILFH